MKKAAVVIGVNSTGDLPVLNAAVSDAKKFADWATAQGFDVTLLTDADGAKVSLGDIKTAIKAFVQKATYAQLVVFFTGHGLLRAAEYELWLLSEAPADPDEAVNVAGSILQARNAGIPHVVFISDACRSRPASALHAQMIGGVIFPNIAPKAPRPVVDTFYASLPGDPALEAPAEDATANYRSIFTDCLLKGLTGKVPAVIEKTTEAPTPKWVVPSWRLKDYLEEEVPDVASNIAIQLRQNPEVRVESHPPKYLAEVPAPPAGAHLAENLPGPRRDSTSVPFGQPESLPNPAAPMELQGLRRDAKFKQAVTRLIRAQETRQAAIETGFTIHGAAVQRARATRTSCEVFEEYGIGNIRVQGAAKPGNAQSILIQFANGSGTVLAVLPGFIGTVVVEDQRVVSVSYTPEEHTPRYQSYVHVAAEIERRRAFAAVAARNGSFRLDGKHVAEHADYLRVEKSLDPTLGLYAAYAYAQAGITEEVESVCWYMEQEPASMPIPFDVALLAGRLPKTKRARKNPRIAPFCPMLAQGWAYLGPWEKPLPDAVRQAGRQMVPALWTTFTPEGVDHLWLALDKGEIR